MGAYSLAGLVKYLDGGTVPRAMSGSATITYSQQNLLARGIANLTRRVYRSVFAETYTATLKSSLGAPLPLPPVACSLQPGAPIACHL